jgi:hypothetical protein
LHKEYVMKNSLNFGGSALLAALLLGQSSAQAHIDMVSHESRAGGDQKSDPCEGRPRGSKVYTYRPGETITITLNESVGHPGYFRIAFDGDGENDFKIPSGTEGTDGDCGGDSACGPGKADYCNSPAVMWDNLDQHSASIFTGGMHTWSITLPNVECTNCTLQVIQMMNDLNIHFSPYPADDIYYRCIDIVLSKTAQEVNDAPVMNKGMECKSFNPVATGAKAVAGDAGVGTPDGGATMGGGATTGGGATMGGGVITDGGTPPPMTSTAGGAAGGTVAPGGTAGTGTAGGTTTTVSPATGTAGGTAGTGGVPPAASAGGTAGVAPLPPAAEDDGGCSLTFGNGSTRHTGIALGLLALALLGRRRGQKRSH